VNTVFDVSVSVVLGALAGAVISALALLAAICVQALRTPGGRQ
jgi:hypothetical protein